jgi:isopenicillin-N N-acyltransferase like protein
MPSLRVLRISGSPYEMGYAHGKAFAADIIALTEERLHLCTDPTWTGGRVATLDEVLAEGRACLRAHIDFSPELMDELRGMGDATGLGLNELVIMNGFTDFVDVLANDRNAVASGMAASQLMDDEGGCTSFVVGAQATRDQRALIGQTWDMHSSATPHVLLLDIHPDDGPAILTLSITGCVGMIGMNEYGIAVGINNLLGADGQPGVHWPFVVRKMLAQDTIEGALDVLRRAPLSGGHNYALLGPDLMGELTGYNVEAMATRSHVSPVESLSAHTNHCTAADLVEVERPRKSLSATSTHNRLEQSTHFLAANLGALDVERIMEMTRHHEGDEMSICAHARPEYDVETSAACIMAPATRELWAVWGLPCQNEYEHFVIGERMAAP